ncbi:extracellular solute-binding protein [Pseudalkalibacillus sp. A8]|uniref:extracellular solute-binding protein n=1 Tax=Pseudalkalibacillus sp. A8 TaxID=3382641 RepID=UPI0038B637B1
MKKIRGNDMEEKMRRDTFKMRLDEMVVTLRSEIITGKYHVGDYLPSEVSIAKRFQLSKNSVRKGLDLLVDEGLILKKSRVGNLVVSNRTEDITTLRVGYYPSLVREVQLFALVESFKKKFPSIEVQLVALPYDKYSEIVLDYFDNNMIDVITINHQHFVEMEPHAGKFETIERDGGIYSFLKEPFSIDGELLVQPLTFSPVVLCYNRDIFEQYNIEEPDSSWNWQRITDISDELEVNSEGRIFGFYFHPMSANRWPIFLMQENIVDKNSDSIDKKRLLQAVSVGKHIFNVRKVGMNLLSDNDSDAEQLFKDQKVAMIMATYFSLNQFKETQLNYDIAPLPYSENAKTMLLIIGLAINKQSKNRHAARVFIDYLKSDEVQKRIYVETLSIPVMKRIAEARRDSDEESHQRPNRYHLFREVIPTFRLFNESGLSFDEMRMFKNVLRLYWSGLINDDEFHQSIQEGLRASRGEGVEYVESSRYS